MDQGIKKQHWTKILYHMDTSPITLPKPIPTSRFRQPKKNIPQTIEERNSILQVVRDYVAKHKPVPPQPAQDLKVHASAIIEDIGCDPIYRDYIGVLINNEIWRESLASIPFERRLLLIPKCLRVEEKCPAPFDEFGLLCKQCGLCSIQDFQNEAEKLGYAVLVAEGSAIVMSLIQTGKIEAIVGVSCLSVLERSFPYMEAAAIPGIAIPLLQDDCIDCTVDQDWVWDVIHLTSDDKTRRMDLTAIREDVDSWFSAESLETIMGSSDGQSEDIARDWLGRSGKRWRPFLTVSAYNALRENPEEQIPESVKKIAVAVECFHKASLIHDDIEDQDAERYGEKTLHEEYGIPVALNIGDLLIGEGYRLIGESGFSDTQIHEMLNVASTGQRELCKGQGSELIWTKNPKPLSSRRVLGIFQKKTAPAFEVALRLGAIASGRHNEVDDALGKYSEALGIAYQIRDDLNDIEDAGDPNDIEALRPNILMGIAHEKAKGQTKDIFKSLWERKIPDGLTPEKIRELYSETGAVDRAKSLLETYKETAIRSLAEVEVPNLKGLLRRTIGKIFNDTEIKGWCKEFEVKNGVRGENSKMSESSQAEAEPPIVPSK